MFAKSDFDTAPKTHFKVYSIEGKQCTQPPPPTPKPKSRDGTASKHHAQHDTVLPTTLHPSNRARKHTLKHSHTELFQLTPYKPF